MAANTVYEEYRVNYIRGRAQRLLDSMLPAFANVVNEICPTNDAALTNLLVGRLETFFPGSEVKTLRNYSTEIIGQLFGMIAKSKDGLCSASPLTRKLLDDDDQPAFFKVLASRIQFPNPMNRSRQDYEKSVLDGCNVRPLVLVIEVLTELGAAASYLELRTFVLANKFALSGKVSAKTLAEQILEARKNHLLLPDPDTPNRPYNHQHIREMLGLLVLANLINESSQDTYSLNLAEEGALKWISETRSNLGLFRDLKPAEEYQDFQREWTEWYGALPEGVELEELNTPLAALEIDLSKSSFFRGDKTSNSQSTQEVGRIGEEIVLNWQLRSVSELRPQDLKHVKDKSMERGIGYDIQTVWCSTNKAGQFRFFEVKTTKRKTRPDASSSQLDLVTLTANEYRAAISHGDNYAICRVYLFTGGFEVFVIDDPVHKHLLGEVVLEPADWNLYLTDKVIVEADFKG